VNLIKLCLIFIGVLLLALIGLAAVSKMQCESKWAQGALGVQWGPFKGCLLKTPSGRWIPAERVGDTGERK